ncbi:unnamed protein product [Amoebophrya sp. A25]|nr:unnamed protein product [Amoebophrya sp. A25]|eukprot:GSA25T00015955001.1
MKNSFSPRTLLLKSIGLSLVVGAGLALGKEGPLIQVGVCWAHILANLKGIPFLRSNRYTRFFHEESSSSTINIPLYEWSFVGAAVGVSTAFGAPLGGVLFAVEELGSVRTITRRALLLCFLGSFAASFTLKFLDLTGSNNVTMFSLSTASNSFRKEWEANEIWLFILLGVLGGLISSAFIRMNVHVNKWRKRRKEQHGTLWFLSPERHRFLVDYFIPDSIMRRIRERGSHYRISSRVLVVLEGCAIAVVTSVSNYLFTRLLRFHSTVAIHALFETCPHEKGLKMNVCKASTFNASFSMNVQLLLAAGIRLLQTVITFGAMLPSGLFIPSLFIGATVGRFVGNLTFLVVQEQHIEPGVFAMIGAAAMLAGFTRMTVSLVVIMFELTGELNYVIPFMCAVITAKVVGDLFTSSIYEEVATLNGFANIEDTPTSIRLEVLVADLAEEYPWSRVMDAEQSFTFAQLRQLAFDQVPGLHKRETRKEQVEKEPSAADRMGRKALGENSTDEEADTESEEGEGSPLSQSPASVGRRFPSSRMVAAGSDRSIILVRQGLGPIYGFIRMRRLRQWIRESMRGDTEEALEARICSFTVGGGGGLWAERLDVGVRPSVGLPTPRQPPLSGENRRGGALEVTSGSSSTQQPVPTSGIQHATAAGTPFAPPARVVGTTTSIGALSPVNTSGVDIHQGGSSGDGNDDEPAPEDLSFLVDTRIAKLSMDAHILTLFCVFHQNPKLKYIVCSSSAGLRLGVVSRPAFIDALCDRNLAQPPLHLGVDDAQEVRDSERGSPHCIPFFGGPGAIPGAGPPPLAKPYE